MNATPVGSNIKGGFKDAATPLGSNIKGGFRDAGPRSGKRTEMKKMRKIYFYENIQTSRRQLSSLT